MLALLTLELSFSSRVVVPSSTEVCVFLRLRRLLGMTTVSGECAEEEGDDDDGGSIGFEDMFKSSMMRS